METNPIFDKFVFQDIYHCPSWFVEQVGRRIILTGDNFSLDGQLISKGAEIALLSSGKIIFLPSDFHKSDIHDFSKAYQIDDLFRSVVQEEVDNPDINIYTAMINSLIKYLNSESYSFTVLKQFLSEYDLKENNRPANRDSLIENTFFKGYEKTKDFKLTFIKTLHLCKGSKKDLSALMNIVTYFTE